MASGIRNWHRGDRRITYDVLSDDWSEEYDVYEFLPSVSPNALFPVVKASALLPPLANGDLLQLPVGDCLEDDGIGRAEDASLLSPLLSPIYSFASEVDEDPGDASFPNSAKLLSVVGYSKVFTSGLASKSHRVTRQLDNILRKLREVLHRLKALS